jgi:TPR repeat protein
MIFCGCVFADVKENRHGSCPFCRAPPAKNIASALQELNKRAEINDHDAFYSMGAIYNQGEGVVQDKSKALEYFIRGAELGSTRASCAVANAFYMGDRVEKDAKKAMYYYELAAMKGDNASRCQLGIMEA